MLKCSIKFLCGASVVMTIALPAFANTNRSSEDASSKTAAPVYYTNEYIGLISTGDFIGQQAELYVNYAYPSPSGNQVFSDNNGLYQNLKSDAPVEVASFQHGTNAYAIYGDASGNTGRFSGESDNGTNEIYDDVDSLNGDYANAEVQSNDNTFLPTANLFAPVKYTLSPNDVGEVSVEYGPNAQYGSAFIPTSVISGPAIGFGLAGGGTTGSLPEPSTWLTMIMGFGFIGWTIRRHKLPTVSLSY